MLDISFRTAHSSKGLETDYVIVLGLHTGSYAFPSEISKFGEFFGCSNYPDCRYMRDVGRTHQ
jgi:superfamily I DNA/RNA helicase